jgi:DNA-binding CsgD family transcriptional regulator
MVFNRTERLICRALTNGHSAAEIAEDLEMAISSVGRHMRSAISKAALHNRYELLVFLFQSPQSLSKGGRFTPGLHAAAICGCNCCCYMRAEKLSPDVPSARELVTKLREPVDWKDTPPANLPK